MSFPLLLSPPILSQSNTLKLQSNFIPTLPKHRITIPTKRETHHVTITCSTPTHKLVRDPRLDKHVVKQNKTRFVHKLKTLILSKPKHFMPIQVLYKCRPYLSLPKPNSILNMIRRYPAIFELFTIPVPPKPINAVGTLNQLCVRLTPPASDIAKREFEFKKSMGFKLADKLQKLLMLASPCHRLLLAKLAHLGPDLGLPVNFRSRLCNEYPDRFKVVDTSYGRALQLVSWDARLANCMPPRDEVASLGLIVDRPLKFKHLRLRKGLNVKRTHHDYLVKFKEYPDVCPYKTNVSELGKDSIAGEKRACAVVREVLAMMVEKRTLVDHLTHFRREFGLSNKLRGMLVRHPDMFYVSLKGQRDSVFLVEGYSDKGKLLKKDEIFAFKEEWMALVREGKKMRREGMKEHFLGDVDNYDGQNLINEIDDDYDFEDGLDDLFELDDCSEDDLVDESEELMELQEEEEFWMAETNTVGNGNTSGSVPW